MQPFPTKFRLTYPINEFCLREVTPDEEFNPYYYPKTVADDFVDGVAVGKDGRPLLARFRMSHMKRYAHSMVTLINLNLAPVFEVEVYGDAEHACTYVLEFYHYQQQAIFEEAVVRPLRVEDISEWHVSEVDKWQKETLDLGVQLEIVGTINDTERDETIVLSWLAINL